MRFLQHLEGKNQRLPALADRETRILLVAWSYTDAATGINDHGSQSKPTSRIPGRNPELWPFGSYTEFEKAMGGLNGSRGEFYDCFVRGTGPATSGARRALQAVIEVMPRFVHVPAAISIAAGYLPSEAKAYTRKGDPEIRERAPSDASA